MKCYKVVRKNDEGKLVSVVVPEGAAQVVYTPKEKISATPIMAALGYGICTFDDKEEARSFANRWDGEVWNADGEEPFEKLPKRVQEIEALETNSPLTLAWETKIKGSRDRDWPCGTVMYKHVTLSSKTRFKYR